MERVIGKQCTDREKLDQFIAIVQLYQMSLQIVRDHKSESGASVFHTGALAMKDAIAHYLVSSANGMKGVINDMNMAICHYQRKYEHGDIGRLLYSHGVVAEILEEKEMKTIINYDFLNNLSIDNETKRTTGRDQ